MSADLPKLPEPIRAFAEYANEKGYDIAYTYDTDRSRWVFLNPMTADLWRYWLASREEAMALLLEALHQLPIAASCWNEDEDRDLAARNVEHVLGLIKRIDALSKGNQ